MEVDLYFKWNFTGENHISSYINGTLNPKGILRSPALKRLFFKHLPQIVSELKEMSAGTNYDFVIMPPTRRETCEDLKKAFLNDCCATDLSNMFSKVNYEIGAGCKINYSFTTLYENIVFSPFQFDLKDINGIAILDDLINEGKTIKVLVKKLIENGLCPQCKIVVFSIVCELNEQVLFI